MGTTSESRLPNWDPLPTEQAADAVLIMRISEGGLRQMKVRDWLKRESENGKKTVEPIVFNGERFDVMSVRRWRER